MYIPKTGVVSDRTLRRIMDEVYGMKLDKMAVITSKIAFRLNAFIVTGLYQSLSKKRPDLIIPEHDISFNVKVLNELLKTNSNQELVYDTTSSFYEKSCKAVIDCAKGREEC